MQTIAASARAEDAPWEESVSAWMDGESPEPWLDRLEGAEGKETWDTYHLIGDVLRSSELALQPSAAFRSRLSQALDNELAIVAAPRPRGLRPGWRLGLSGLAAAAAVATATLATQPGLFGSDRPRSETRIIADATLAPGDDAAFSDYLEAHRQLAGPSAVRRVSFDAGTLR